jgi:hypothetical protein
VACLVSGDTDEDILAAAIVVAPGQSHDGHPCDAQCTALRADWRGACTGTPEAAEALQVREAPSWPTSWANSSLL